MGFPPTSVGKSPRVAVEILGVEVEHHGVAWLVGAGRLRCRARRTCARSSLCGNPAWRRTMPDTPSAPTIAFRGGSGSPAIRGDGDAVRPSIAIAGDAASVADLDAARAIANLSRARDRNSIRRTHGRRAQATAFVIVSPPSRSATAVEVDLRRHSTSTPIFSKIPEKPRVRRFAAGADLFRADRSRAPSTNERQAWVRRAVHVGARVEMPDGPPPDDHEIDPAASRGRELRAILAPWTRVWGRLSVCRRVLAIAGNRARRL